MEPRPYQKEALGAWRRDGLRGVVVLPTGAGKTAVAVSAMERVGRSTLVVVPTLALLKQWYSVLQDAFGGSVTIGLLGGGYHEITPLTVTTYDSAYIHAERYGDRFALVVYDEVHHLPAPKNADHPEDAPRALLPRPHGHAGAARRRPRAPARACRGRSSTGARPRIWRGPTSPPSNWCAYPSS